MRATTRRVHFCGMRWWTRRPAVVVRCAGAAPMWQLLVGFLRGGSDLELGIRCGGHSVLGISVPDGGLLIDLAELGARFVWMQTLAGLGCKGGFIGGFRPGGPGSSGLGQRRATCRTPGSAGSTLGGGMGWLAQAVRPRLRQPAPPTRLSPLTARRCGSASRSTRTCSGGCAGAAATSASSREFEFRLHQVQHPPRSLIGYAFALDEAPCCTCGTGVTCWAMAFRQTGDAHRPGSAGWPIRPTCSKRRATQPHGRPAWVLAAGGRHPKRPTLGSRTYMD